MIGVSELPANWEKRLDKNTGQYFYVNHVTKKTQWEPPSGECLCVCQLLDITLPTHSREI